jgi:hypothetical protein
MAQLLMDKRHLNWAKGHDWGRQAFLKEGKILVPNDGENTCEPYAEIRGAWREFCSFENLYHWAGY